MVDNEKQIKRAVLLHGTDGNPDDLWFPWLRKQLENSGYQVFSPLLPDNHTPNRATYDDFLKSSGWDFNDDVVIGHSSGATTALNLLSADWFPKVRSTVLVGAFLNEHLLQVNAPEWYDQSQFTNLFSSDYDVDLLKEKGGKFYFVHGSDDPYCDIGDARKLCGKVGGVFIEIPDGGHLSGGWGVKEIPQLTDRLKADNLL